MLRSMTGFGAAANEDAHYALRVEIRAVNHRHLQVKTRLPQEFAALEPQVERLVRSKLSRGSLNVYLNSTRLASASPARIDAELLGRYRRELAAVAKTEGLDEPELEDLLQLPGVVGTSDDAASGPDQTKRIEGLLKKALSALVKMRSEEGAALEKDLRKNAKAIDRLAKRIDKRMPVVVKAHRSALEKRVGELMGRRHELSPSDLAREAALLADRLDVSEEITRLASHLEQLDAFLAKGGAIGRKLDFLVQEIFREVNTVGSKCNDAQVSHWVVEAKTHVERLREQVQNVE